MRFAQSKHPQTQWFGIPLSRLECHAGVWYPWTYIACNQNRNFSWWKWAFPRLGKSLLQTLDVVELTSVTSFLDARGPQRGVSWTLVYLLAYVLRYMLRVYMCLHVFTCVDMCLRTLHAYIFCMFSYILPLIRAYFSWITCIHAHLHTIIHACLHACLFAHVFLIYTFTLHALFCRHAHCLCLCDFVFMYWWVFILISFFACIQWYVFILWPVWCLCTPKRWNRFVGVYVVFSIIWIMFDYFYFDMCAYVGMCV